jgi:hypothetical protein
MTISTKHVAAQPVQLFCAMAGRGSLDSMAPGEPLTRRVEIGWRGTVCISQISSRAGELHDRTVLGFATKMGKTRPPSW